MNERETKHSEMRGLADALTYAIAYLNVATGDDDRHDDDCRALESIVHTLDSCSVAEQQALADAATRAITRESAVASPNNLLVSTYRDILDDFNERFPNTRNA